APKPKLVAKKGVTAAMVRKWEEEFGKKVAVQMALDVDPRKDLIRKQGSRFQGIVDQERKAKRDRRLAELEAEDDAQEKMEAVTSIKIGAYKCRQCAATFDSDATRVLCEEKGHTVVRVQVNRTRWECSGCRQSQDVLDRELPSHCRKCNAIAWKQVPLRRVKREAPMERDMLLPRGEELKFVNSVHIPGQQAVNKFREASEDYSGL
ncbi:unnamed protein product, partial [Polarella glacialis]